ncbi:MAG: sigma-70 family RNA polymerase sigma factor [Clostridia bacterium]|nr:sigma-70 family RNA polymerase sigma factor [Clostridia bacterium]
MVERFRSGDEQAFALLSERMLPMVRQQVAATQCSGADSDDLMQEGLLALLRAAQAFRPDGGASFATYARLCVKHRLWNAAQRLMSHETPQEDESLFSQMEKDGAAGDPSELVLGLEEETAFLMRLKHVLSDLEYRVMVLHVAAYSYEEIAAVLSISQKSVDNALCRIRGKLSRLI